MEILEKGPPKFVFIQDGMSETDDFIVVTGDHCELSSLGLDQSTSPHLLAIGNDVPVKVGVQVGASVVSPPAFGMEGSDGVGIAVSGVEIMHNQGLVRHSDLLIDPGVGTVQWPAAGPSKGQVPQVALDERTETIHNSVACNAELSHPSRRKEGLVTPSWVPDPG